MRSRRSRILAPRLARITRGARIPVAAAGVVVLGLCFRASLQSATSPPPVIQSVVNAASFQPGPLSPGEVITVFGEGLGPDSAIVARPDGAGRFPYSLGTTRVLINRQSAPLLYVSRTQVTAVVPLQLAPGTPVTVEVDYRTITSTPQISRIAQASPALFTSTQTGRDQAAALNEDGTPNSADRPASPGSIISVFVSGGGRTRPASQDATTVDRMLDADSQVTATVAGSPAEVIYAGSAPGLIAGMMQVNLRLPASTPSGGRVFLALNFGGAGTPTGTTVAVANGAAALPDRPAGFEAAARSGGVDLTWRAIPDARRVRIERGSTDGGAFTEVAAIGGGASSWTDAELRPSSGYAYRIRFETEAGYSEYATAGPVFTPDSFVSAPEKLAAKALGSSTVLVSWTNRASADTAVIVERSTGGDFAPVARLAGSAGFYRDADVSPGRSYSYRVRAVAASGTSQPSRSVDAATPDAPRLSGAALKIHPLDPHRLARGGSTWTMAGYYPSLGAFTTDQYDWTLYRRLIDSLAANGINYFRIAFTMGQPYGDSMNVYRRTGPGNALDGRPKFDLAQFDQSYFDYWRQIVQYADAKGLIVQICMMDGWHSTADVVEDNGQTRSWGLRFDYYYADNNINGVNVSAHADLADSANAVFWYQRALLRKIVDTLGDLPNIVWEIANESGQLPWELLLADEVTAYERAQGVYEHLVIPRDLPGHQYVPAQCDNTPGPAHADLVRAFPQNLVLITDNDCTDAPPAAVRRAKAWAALTAGAQMDFFHFSMTDPSVLASDDTVSGMYYVGLQRKFISDLNIELAGMLPLDAEVTNGWAIGRSGAEYIIYLPSGGATSVRSLGAAGRAVWFNPRDGSTVEAGSGPEFRSPDSNDWVLYLLR